MKRLISGNQLLGAALLSSLFALGCGATATGDDGTAGTSGRRGSAGGGAAGGGTAGNGGMSGGAAGGGAGTAGGAGAGTAGAGGGAAGAGAGGGSAGAGAGGGSAGSGAGGGSAGSGAGGGTAGSGGGIGGAGGGTAGSGGGLGGSGGGTGAMCSGSGQMCVDASGMGDFACIDGSTMDGFPANAPVCNMTMMCPTGFSCWVTMQGATSGKCLQDCMGSGAAGSGGGAAGSGGGAAGSGGGMAGTCPVMGQMCVNADNMGSFACIDPAVMGGFPANAPTCSQTMMCPSGSNCWVTMQGATTGKCLVDCTVMSGGGGMGGAGG